MELPNLPQSVGLELGPPYHATTGITSLSPPPGARLHWEPCIPEPLQGLQLEGAEPGPPTPVMIPPVLPALGMSLWKLHLCSPHGGREDVAPPG